MALRWIDAFADTEGPIVAPSGSCVEFVKHRYPLMFDTESAEHRRAAAVAARVMELSQFLVNVLKVTDVGAYFPHRVTYHPTCHSLRVAQVGDRPQQLLRAVRGITVVELPNATECCGFGGTFSVKNPDMSISMASDKARHVRETGAEVLVAGDNMCLMNIGGVLKRQRAGVRIMHLAEILASTEEDPA